MNLKKYLNVLNKTASHFNLDDIHNSHQNCSDFSRSALLFAKTMGLESMVRLVVAEVQSNINYNSRTNKKNYLADDYTKGEWYGHELLLIDGSYYDFTICQFGYENGYLGASLPEYIREESSKNKAEIESNHQFYKYMLNILTEHH